MILAGASVEAQPNDAVRPDGKRGRSRWFQYRFLFSVPAKGDGTMPGVDFRLLRERIAMRDVLHLLQFEPTVQRGTSGAVPARCMVRPNPRSRSFSVNVRLGGTIASVADRVAMPWNCGQRTWREPACRGSGVVPAVGTGDTLGDTLVARDKRQNNSKGDCIDRGLGHDPCGPCSVRGGAWIFGSHPRRTSV